jgi:predicted DNA-binding transcriptional regulator AlpA
VKARQSAKIRELRVALVASGFMTIDEQSKVLGLSRSTTWTILKGDHKASGLSAAIIDRMLAAPRLPPLVRTTIHEYIQDKAAGLYGDSKTALRKFTARLSGHARGSRRYRSGAISNLKTPKGEKRRVAVIGNDL